jgi:hypothetical protein
MLGVVVAFSEVVLHRTVGVAGAFDKLAAFVGHWLFPWSQYYRQLMPAAIGWQSLAGAGHIDWLLFVEQVCAASPLALATRQWLDRALWASTCQAFGDRVLRSRAGAVRSGHGWWLHQRTCDLGWGCVGSSGVLVHGRDVRCRHPHRLGLQSNREDAMSEALVTLIVGGLFGWALNKAGLTHYARIVDVYLLRDWTVIRFMLSALLVGAVGIRLGLAFGLTNEVPLPQTHALSNLLGGAIFGVGMASAGYCPGTIVAEAGEGRLDACSAGAVGLICGALAYGLTQPWLMPPLNRVGDWGRITLASWQATTPWLVVCIFSEVLLLGLVLLANTTTPTSASERDSGH